MLFAEEKSKGSKGIAYSFNDSMMKNENGPCYDNNSVGSFSNPDNDKIYQGKTLVKG